MLKIDPARLVKMEKDYPGITHDINRFERMNLPRCSYCGSSDTASVQCGLIGRTIAIFGATTKFKLVANGPLPFNCFCNDCEMYFG